MTERRSGFVIHWDEEKGFGFVRPQDGSVKLFFHRSALEAAKIYEIARGDLLTFNIGTRAGRALAVDIEKNAGGW